MNTDQLDMFGAGKSVDEVQLERAVEVVECAGYRVVKDKEGAKELAVEQGYVVLEQPIINENVVTLTDLRNYFFMWLWTKYPSRQKNHYENWQQELRMIRLFVESIEQRGFNRSKAIQRGIEIIDAIFTHEKEFNFRDPIGIGVLGQGKAGWITGKAIEILNRRLDKQMQSEMEKRASEIENELEEQIETDKTLSKLDEILAKME